MSRWALLKAAISGQGTEGESTSIHRHKGFDVLPRLGSKVTATHVIAIDGYDVVGGGISSPGASYTMFLRRHVWKT
jgi:hypothetical protein